jgi:hypothetical protein
MENREPTTGNSEPVNGEPTPLARSPFPVPCSRFSIAFSDDVLRASGCSSSTVLGGSSARECFVESQEGPQRFVGRARVRKPGSYVRLQDPQKGRSSGGFARQPAAPCPAPVVPVHVAFRELCGINLLPHISSEILPPHETYRTRGRPATEGPIRAR